MPDKPNTFSLNPNPKRTRPKDNRGSAHSRGYTSRWHRRTRKAQLMSEPLCRECKKQGRVTAAKVVDHIIPKRKGGTDETKNLQSLCTMCHNKKTRRGE